jgi:glucosyl-3-phosphoglycerate synthase
VDVREAAPGLGPLRGKGDTVRRSLAVVDAELLLYVDGDLEDVDERYVRGLAGPLLTHPEVQLVKAAFQRPARAGTAAAYGGGRVTELTAKPLLAALYPELTALAQPLSGQVGVRADWLRSLRLWPGYGLEAGVLLQTYKRAGLGAIAEVDIGTLLNRHQEIAMLAGMAADVVEAILHEVAEEGRLTPQPEPAEAI